MDIISKLEGKLVKWLEFKEMLASMIIDAMVAKYSWASYIW